MTRRNVPRAPQNHRSAMSRCLAGLTVILAAGLISGAFGVRAQSPNTIQDPLLKEPYVDVDEWRSEPVRHRYVHGGFKGTEARFSIYFPPKEQ
jgi:hypothetical protein